MGLRPAKTVRIYQGQPWARISQKKPRKSYVKGAPRPKVRDYLMGVDKRFEIEVDLAATEPIQLRDNALEAARQAANKHLEKNLPGGYFLQILKYPHLVIRESAALGVAGADRISKGMKRAFGRPKGRMARVKLGEAVLRVRTTAGAYPTVREAFARATQKLSGHWKPRVRDITRDPKNLARSLEGTVFKTKEEVKPVAEAAPAAAEGAAPVEGAAAGEKTTEGEKGEKKAEKKK